MLNIYPVKTKSATSSKFYTEHENYAAYTERNYIIVKIGNHISKIRYSYEMTNLCFFEYNKKLVLVASSGTVIKLYDIKLSGIIHQIETEHTIVSVSKYNSMLLVDTSNKYYLLSGTLDIVASKSIDYHCGSILSGNLLVTFDQHHCIKYDIFSGTKHKIENHTFATISDIKLYNADSLLIKDSNGIFLYDFKSGTSHETTIGINSNISLKSRIATESDSINLLVESILEDNRISLIINGTGTLNVNWGDNCIDRINMSGTTIIEHVYSNIDKYTISMLTNDTIDTISVGNFLNAKLIAIDSFGNVGLQKLLSNEQSKNIKNVPLSLPPSIRDLSGLLSYSVGVQLSNLANWDFSNIELLDSFLLGASDFSLSVDNKSFLSLVSMSKFMNLASNFVADFNNINFAKLENIDYMFGEVNNSRINLSQVLLNEVTSASKCFYKMDKINLSINNINLNKLTFVLDWFAYSKESDILITDLEATSLTSLSSAFYSSNKSSKIMHKIHLRNINVPECKSFNSMFSGSESSDIVIDIQSNEHLDASSMFSDTKKINLEFISGISGTVDLTNLFSNTHKSKFDISFIKLHNNSVSSNVISQSSDIEIYIKKSMSVDEILISNFLINSSNVVVDIPLLELGNSSRITKFVNLVKDSDISIKNILIDSKCNIEDFITDITNTKLYVDQFTTGNLCRLVNLFDLGHQSSLKSKISIIKIGEECYINKFISGLKNSSINVEKIDIGKNLNSIDSNTINFFDNILSTPISIDSIKFDCYSYVEQFFNKIKKSRLHISNLLVSDNSRLIKFFSLLDSCNSSIGSITLQPNASASLFFDAIKSNLEIAHMIAESNNDLSYLFSSESNITLDSAVLCQPLSTFKMFSSNSAITQVFNNVEFDSKSEVSDLLLDNKSTVVMNNWIISDDTNIGNIAENNTGEINAHYWTIGDYTNMYALFGQNKGNLNLDNWTIGNYVNLTDTFRNQSFSLKIKAKNWIIGKYSKVSAGSVNYSDVSLDIDLSNWEFDIGCNISYFFGKTPISNSHIVMNKWRHKSTDMSYAFSITGSNISCTGISSWLIGKSLQYKHMFSDNNWFNEDLSKWNVNHVLSIPDDFNNNSILADHYLPNWLSDQKFISRFDSKLLESVDLDKYFLIEVEVSKVTAMQDSFYFCIKSSIDQEINGFVIDTTETKQSININLLKNQYTEIYKDSNMKSGLIQIFLPKEFVIDEYQFFKNPIISINEWEGNAQVISGISNKQSLPLLRKIPDYIPKSVLQLKDILLNAVNFDQDISMLDTSNLTNMDFMFYGTNKFNYDISKWEVDSVKSAIGFYENSNIDSNHVPLKFRKGD